MLSRVAGTVEQRSRTAPIPSTSRSYAGLRPFSCGRRPGVGPLRRKPEMPMRQPIDDFTELLPMRQRFVMISGCSGGGKSTLLAALAQRGFAVAPEPGREIVREQLVPRRLRLAVCGTNEAFAELVISRAMDQLRRAGGRDGVALFDRGLVDAFAGFVRVRARDPSACRGGRRRAALCRHGVHGATLAGDLRGRSRAPARFRGGRGGVPRAGRGLWRARLPAGDAAEGGCRGARRFRRRAPAAPQPISAIDSVS